MRAYEIFENELLTERIHGRTAVVYHRTHYLSTINEITEGGFRAGDGDTYGRGIYSTYEFKSQLTDYMLDHYGTYIIRARVQLHGMVICDYAIAKQVYGDRYTLMHQIEDLKLRVVHNDGNVDARTKEMVRKAVAKSRGERHGHQKPVLDDLREISADLEIIDFTSDLAKELYEKLRGMTGLVYTGRNDGHCIVVYEPKKMIPLAWAKEEAADTAKSETDLEWTRVDAAELARRAVRGPAPKAPDDDGDDDYDEYGRALPTQNNPYDYSPILQKERSIIRRQMKAVRRDPDAVLTMASVTQQILNRAITLKPSLIVQLGLRSQRTKQTLITHPELVEPFFSGPGWAREQDYSKGTFLASANIHKLLGQERIVQMIIDQKIKDIRQTDFAEIVKGDFDGFKRIMQSDAKPKNGRFLYELSHYLSADEFKPFAHLTLLHRAPTEPLRDILDTVAKKAPDLFAIPTIQKTITQSDRYQMMAGNPELFLKYFTPTPEEIARQFENIASGTTSPEFPRIYDTEKWLILFAPYIDLSLIPVKAWEQLRRYTFSHRTWRDLFSTVSMTPEQAMTLVSIFDYKMESALIAKIKSGELHLTPQQFAEIEASSRTWSWPFMSKLLQDGVPVPREVQMAAVAARPDFYCSDDKIRLHPDAAALCQQQK